MKAWITYQKDGRYVQEVRHGARRKLRAMVRQLGKLHGSAWAHAYRVGYNTKSADQTRARYVFEAAYARNGSQGRGV